MCCFISFLSVPQVPVSECQHYSAAVTSRAECEVWICCHGTEQGKNGQLVFST